MDAKLWIATVIIWSDYLDLKKLAYLTHFMPLVAFYTPWKQKISGFLMLSKDIEKDYMHEMG